MKRIAGAVVSIFISWNIIDYIVHGIILNQAYQETSQLWRPMAEMKMGLIYISVFISAVVFVLIYQRLVSNKSISNAIQYGILLGIGVGISMGYGTYAVMPIPYAMALTWFLTSILESAVAGILLGVIIKE